MARRPYDTVPLFLKAIGRGCESHASKFPSWTALFSSDASDMKKLGIPVRERKWILNWTSKYGLGIDPYYIAPSARSVKKGRWKP